MVKVIKFVPPAIKLSSLIILVVSLLPENTDYSRVISVYNQADHVVCILRCHYTLSDKLHSSVQIFKYSKAIT